MEKDGQEVPTISSAIDLDAFVRQCPDKLRCVTCTNLCSRIRELELKYSPGGANLLETKHHKVLPSDESYERQPSTLRSLLL